MSDHSQIELPPDGERLDESKIASIRRVAFAIGFIGLIASGILFFTPLAEKFIYSWLFGFYYFFSIALGGLFWMLLHHATNSGWGIAVRRVFENIACVIPFMFLLAIPLLIPHLRDSLYEWTKQLTEIEQEMHSGEVQAAAGATAGEAHDDHSLRHAVHMKAQENPHLHLLYHKYPYLNKGFFYFRVFFYFISLGLIALWMRSLSKRQDTDGNHKWTLRMRRAACGFLPVFAVCASFASIDFLKCLDYVWFSTMWGVYIFAGSALNSMAVAILLVLFLKRLGYLKLVNQEHLHIMGKLMFAFVIFWAYVTFSQYFLIWYANIPEETKYFITRNTGNWHIGSSALMWVHFVIPFLFLLPAWVKKSTKYVAIACVWNLIAHVLDYYLIVMPERFVSLASNAEMMEAASPSYNGAFLLDILAFVTVGGLVIWYFLGMLSKSRLYPSRDPRLHESVHLAN